MTQVEVSLAFKIDTKVLCTCRGECVKQNQEKQLTTYILGNIMLAVEIDISSIVMLSLQELNQFLALVYYLPRG